MVCEKLSFVLSWGRIVSVSVKYESNNFVGTYVAYERVITKYVETIGSSVNFENY